MSNYYYILSSLPRFELDQKPDEHLLDEAIDLIKRQCSEEDLSVIKWFFYRNEVYNLIEYWQTKYGHIPARPFRKPNSHSSEDFESLPKNLEVLPPFLREWYESYGEEIQHWSMNEIEYRLQAQFFEAVNGIDSDYVRHFFQFEHQLRAIMASFHQSRYGFIDQELVFYKDALAKHLAQEPLRLSEEDQLEHPYLDKLLQALLSKDPNAITTAVHEVLWQHADDLSNGQYFNQISLLNYIVKLFLLYRREQLIQNKTKPQLQVLVDGALKNFQSWPKEKLKV